MYMFPLTSGEVTVYIVWDLWDSKSHPGEPSPSLDHLGRCVFLEFHPLKSTQKQKNDSEFSSLFSMIIYVHHLIPNKVTV